jgi:hypothetical protein
MLATLGRAALATILSHWLEIFRHFRWSTGTTEYPAPTASRAPSDLLRRVLGTL